MAMTTAAQTLDGSSRVSKPSPPEVLRALVEQANVQFNGDRPWDIQVHDPSVYRRILRQGSLGFGEAYLDGHWDSYQLDELFFRLLSAHLDVSIRSLTKLEYLGSYLKHVFRNPQSKSRAFEVGERHYDIGNDVYEAMLDPTMSYSCAYWEEADDLEAAQQAKLTMICEKLQLETGQRMLDIGCGWGGLARFAAERYGVDVVGITVSKEQARLAKTRCNGLPIEIELKDYRDLSGRFDRVVSVGMFEHVGPKNYRSFFRKVDEVLQNDGIFLLHTIGHHVSTATTDAWIEKYIFPNSKLPSPIQLSEGFEPFFILEDWHNFGQDYDRTLMAWWQNFDAAWPDLRRNYDQRFYRMWKYYLLCCAGFFRSRQGLLWQLVLTKPRRQEMYRSIR